MPFLGTPFKFNLSFLFILIGWLVVGFPWGILLLFLRFLLAPTLSTLGYSVIEIYSQFILLLSELIFLFFLIIGTFLFSKKLTNNYLILIVSFITSVILSTTVLIIFNGLFITPIYWWLLFNLPTPSYVQAINYFYDNLPANSVLFFGIRNYWIGISVIYGAGNVVKFMIIFVILLPIIPPLKHFLS